MFQVRANSMVKGKWMNVVCASQVHFFRPESCAGAAPIDAAFGTSILIVMRSSHPVQM